MFPDSKSRNFPKQKRCFSGCNVLLGLSQNLASGILPTTLLVTTPKSTLAVSFPTVPFVHISSPHSPTEKGDLLPLTDTHRHGG